MEYLVTTDAELTNAIRKAVGGDKIVIAENVKLGRVNYYRGPIYDGVVTIEGLPGAQVTNVGFQQVKNIHVKNLKISNQVSHSSVVISGCDNIKIEDCQITGGYDYGLPEARSYRSGVGIGGSTNVTVSGCKITRVGTGIGCSGSTNVTVSNNHIFDTILDCMNVGSNNENLMICDNLFEGQTERVSETHHYDLLQFWAQVDSTKDLKNIKVLRNTFLAPSSLVTPQAIFGRADYGDNPYMFDDLEIAYNLIVTRHTNAIAIAEGRNIRVHHNVLVYGGTDAWTTRSVFIPGIRVTKSTDVKIHENVFPQKWGYPTVDSEGFFKNTIYRYPV